MAAFESNATARRGAAAAAATPTQRETERLVEESKDLILHTYLNTISAQLAELKSLAGPPPSSTAAAAASSPRMIRSPTSRKAGARRLRPNNNNNHHHHMAGSPPPSDPMNASPMGAPPARRIRTGGPSASAAASSATFSTPKKASTTTATATRTTTTTTTPGSASVRDRIREAERAFAGAAATPSRLMPRGSSYSSELTADSLSESTDGSYYSDDGVEPCFGAFQATPTTTAAATAATTKAVSNTSASAARPPVGRTVARKVTTTIRTTASSSAAGRGKYDISTTLTEEEDSSESNSLSSSLSSIFTPDDNPSMDNYALERVLGTGSFSEVMLARCKRSNVAFAIKKIDKAKQTTPSILDEVKISATMVHPNIIGYRETIVRDAHVCLVLEYADAGTLKAKFDGGAGPQGEAEILSAITQVGLALKHLHDHHIIHRDLKSDNVFLFDDGMVKVADFGLSAMFTPGRLLCQTMGTPKYMSPELAQGNPYGPKTDMWSLGVLLFEMATGGETPFESAYDYSDLLNKMKYQAVPDVPAGSVSTGLRELYHSLLQKDRNARLSSSDLTTVPIVKRAMARHLPGELVSVLSADGSLRKELVSEAHRETTLAHYSSVEKKLSARVVSSTTMSSAVGTTTWGSPSVYSGGYATTTTTGGYYGGGGWGGGRAAYGWQLSPCAGWDAHSTSRPPTSPAPFFGSPGRRPLRSSSLVRFQQFALSRRTTQALRCDSVGGVVILPSPIALPCHCFCRGGDGWGGG